MARWYGRGRRHDLQEPWAKKTSGSSLSAIRPVSAHFCRQWHSAVRALAHPTDARYLDQPKGTPNAPGLARHTAQGCDNTITMKYQKAAVHAAAMTTPTAVFHAKPSRLAWLHGTVKNLPSL